MNKIKKFKKVSILIFILIFTFTFLPQCTDNEKPNSTIKDSESATNNDYGDVVDAEDNVIFYGEKRQEIENANTTYSKIVNALEDGSIKAEEAAMYTLIAEYEPMKLPEEYRGEWGRESAQSEIRYLLKNWDSLDEETINTVLPYIVPLEDERNFMNKPSNGSITGISFIKRVYAADDEFFKLEFTHDSHKFEIQYKILGTWRQARKDIDDIFKKAAEEVKSYIISSWNKFRPLMIKKPSLPYIIELLPMASGTYGEEFHDANNYRIKLNAKYLLDDKIIQSTSAHELFHSFQEELKLGFDKVEEKWFCEATAVWSENYAFPGLNFEHTRHKGFFDTLSKERIAFGNDFEYESYMLFYYLSDYAGTNFIQKLTEKAGKEGNGVIRDYLNNNIKNRKDTYGDFAAYNWNQSPVVKYNDYGPVKGKPTGGSLFTKTMNGNEEDKKSITLKTGAIKYYHYKFNTNDKILQHVKILFENDLSSDDNVKRQALIKIDGSWTREDWSAILEKVYCRKRESKNEKIEELVLIYSNSDFNKEEKSNIDEFTVITEGCPSEMEITIEATFLIETEKTGWESKAQITETLEIKDHWIYLVKEADYDMEGIATYEGRTVLETEGSFSYSTNETEVGDSFPRILLNSTNNVEGAKEAYAKFGISDNVPLTGLLLTVPAITEVGIDGSTTLYFPEPIGNMDIEDPFPLDGLTQLAGLLPSKNEWSSKGLSINKEIDYFSHANPFIGSYSLDMSQFQKQMESMGDLMPEGMPEIPDFNELPGLEDSDDLGGLMNDLLEGIGGDNIFGDMGTTMGVYNDLMSFMMSPKKVDGVSATVTITVEGIYTDFY